MKLFWTAKVSKILTFISYFYKIFITKRYIYIFIEVYFSRQIYSYGFCILKLNNLKVIIYNLYSQYLIQTLFKTIFFRVRREYTTHLAFANEEVLKGADTLITTNCRSC